VLGFLLLNCIRINVFAISFVLSGADPIIALFPAFARFCLTGFRRFLCCLPGFCLFFRLRFSRSFLGF